MAFIGSQIEVGLVESLFQLLLELFHVHFLLTIFVESCIGCSPHIRVSLGGGFVFWHVEIVSADTAREDVEAKGFEEIGQ